MHSALPPLREVPEGRWVLVKIYKNRVLYYDNFVYCFLLEATRKDSCRRGMWHNFFNPRRCHWAELV